MSDAEDKNGASGGAGENPEEEAEDVTERMGSLALEDLAKLPRVYLKLETTGFSDPVHITQIKAQRGEDAFPICFVKPPKPIEKKASRESRITLVNGQMYFRGNSVQSVAIGEALQNFLQFLGDQPVVLLGHDIKRYGGRHLLREAIRCGMIDRLRAVIRGFVDTHPLFKTCAPDLRSYTFETLYRHYQRSGQSFETRDPSDDARVLLNMTAANIPDGLLFQHFFTFTELECRLSWKPLVAEEVISDHIMGKAVRSKLHFDTVRQAFAEGGEERAREVLKQRVTKTQSILDDICDYLRENAE